MKRAIALLLAVCTVVVLSCACGTDPAVETSSGGNTDRTVILNPGQESGETIAPGSPETNDVSGGNTTVNSPSPEGSGSTTRANTDKDNTVSTTLPDVSTVEPDSGIDLRNHNFGGVTIKRIVWYEVGEDEKNMLSEFTKKYNVKVEDVVVDYENINTRLAASMTSGDVIDVGFLYGAFFPTQVIANMYMPIDSYIKRDYMVDTSSAESIAKGGFDMNKMDYFKWNGRYYGFSSYWDVDMMVLYYNKRMFQAADVKTPLEHVADGTWNLDTFYEAAFELTDPDSGVYGWSAGGENTGAGRGTFIASYGTQLVKYDSNGMPQQNLGDSNVLSALQFIQKMYYGSGRVVDTNATFYNGKAAMCTDGLYMIPKLMTDDSVPNSVKNNWEIAPIPMAKGHENDPYPVDWLKSVGILRGSKNPDAAAAYAYFKTAYKGDNLYDEYMTAEQQNRVLPYYESLNYVNYAYGDLITLSGQMIGAICNGSDIAQTLNENKSIFKAQIDRVVNG